jgi:hypothetical protein
MEKIEDKLETEIINRYLSGESNQNISFSLNLHRSTIKRVLKRNGIKLHASKSKLACNDSFFTTYTKESCYWAGFILADGYLRKDSPTLHIKLGIKDVEHLYKFLKCINCEKDIIKKKDTYCYVNICKEKIYNGLNENFEITNKKTFIAEISKKIPNEFLTHFLRGYFEADGSVSIKEKKYLAINFIGTKKVINYLINYFFNNEIKIRTNKRNATNKPVIHDVNKNEKIGIIQYTCNNAEKILNILYQDSSINIRLDRKYDLYLKNKTKS